MRVGGEDGEDSAEGLVGEVVGEPGLDDGQGGAGIEQMVVLLNGLSKGTLGGVHTDRAGAGRGRGGSYA